VLGRGRKEIRLAVRSLHRARKELCSLCFHSPIPCVPVHFTIVSRLLLTNFDFLDLKIKNNINLIIGFHVAFTLNRKFFSIYIIVSFG
jgi:hypothetical protein